MVSWGEINAVITNLQRALHFIPFTADPISVSPYEQWEQKLFCIYSPTSQYRILTYWMILYGKKPNTTHTSSYRRQCNGGFLGKQEAALLFTVRSRLGSRGSWIPTGSSSSTTMPALLFLFPLQPSKGPFLFPPGMFGAPDIFFVWPGPISL